MDATWVGRDPVPRLGYVEWPLTGPTPFREVWQRVVNKGSSLELLMHSVVGVAYNWSHSPSLPPREAAAVAAARQLDVGGSLAASRRCPHSLHNHLPRHTLLPTRKVRLFI